MKNPKLSQLLLLAEKLSNKVAQTLALETDQQAKNLNQQFEGQREFGRELNRKLRALISELDGDLWTLKQRKFDSKMLRMAIKVKTDLEGMLQLVDQNHPHEAARAIADYVLDRHTGSIVDNLEFLVQHHLGITNEETGPSHMFKQVQVNAFKKLKEWGHQLNDYIDNNPPAPVPGTTPPLPRVNPASSHPAEAIDPDMATKV